MVDLGLDGARAGLKTLRTGRIADTGLDQLIVTLAEGRCVDSRTATMCGKIGDALAYLLVGFKAAGKLQALSLKNGVTSVRLDSIGALATEGLTKTALSGTFDSVETGRFGELFTIRTSPEGLGIISLREE